MVATQLCISQLFTFTNNSVGITVMNTVGARIPNIRIPNPFENRTFSCSVLGCSVFEWSIRKPNFQNGRSKLDRFIYKEKNVYT